MLLGFLTIFLFEKQNIVHGDIKPDNLLITRHGTVKIGDFSVSQAFEVMQLLSL
jgi:serine/threonine protein kinase